MAWKSSFRQNYRKTFSPTVPPSATRISRSLRHLVAKVGTSKRGGKQWQTTPKNLPRMQRTRAIPVDWLSSGLCPNWPKGWILIIIILLAWVNKNLQGNCRYLLPESSRTWKDCMAKWRCSYSYSSWYIYLPLSFKSIYVWNIFVSRGVLKKEKQKAAWNVNCSLTG